MLRTRVVAVTCFTSADAVLLTNRPEECEWLIQHLVGGASQDQMSVPRKTLENYDTQKPTPIGEFWVDFTQSPQGRPKS